MIKRTVSLGLGVAAIALGLAAGACGSSDDTAGPCPSDNPNCKALATVEQGKSSVKSRNCTSCHGTDLSGSATKLAGVAGAGADVELYPPNLTDDATGVGAFSDDQLAAAIRLGVDETGLQLCPQMRHYAEMNDYETYSIVKYLRTLPPVSKKIPSSVCPPLKLKSGP